LHLEKPYDTSLDETSFAGRLEKGILTLSRFRKIDTPLEVKNIRRWPGNLAPTRRAFLFSNALHVVVCFLILDLASLSPPPQVAQDLSPQDEFFLHLGGFVGQWVLTYVYILGFYSLGGVCLVSLGIGETGPMRPVFGSLSEAYTLRSFWGNVWQQLGRDGWASPVNLIMYRVLGVSRGSNRWFVMHTKVILVFVVSGALHVVADLTGGARWKDTRSMTFFVLQGVGIIIEDYVRWVFGDDKVVNIPRHWPRWIKILGFVWVCWWLWWTTPYWLVGLASSFDGKSLLPFSVLKPIVRKHLV
jgi:hypothetical protein